MEGWDFILAGGGLYNNLDYSFVAGKEDGTFRYPANQPGGGSPALRRQLGFFSRLFHSLDFVHMRPENGVVKATLPEGASVRTLAQLGKTYLVYLRTGLGDPKKNPNLRKQFTAQELTLDVALPPGKYTTEWYSPASGVLLSRDAFRHESGGRSVAVPAFVDDIALVIRSDSAPARVSAPKPATQ
jgi:hypothetical protein